MDEPIAYLMGVWAWMQAHPVLATLFVLGVVFNTMPRPHPDDPKLSGPARFFWAFIDRLCFLTAIAMPGKLKWFLTPSPPVPSPSPPAAPKEIP